MNEPTTRLETRPEVTAFVEHVRARLSDLTDEEREELVGGLEADIAELVADGGSVAELGDPRAYADELRSAAGLDRRGGAGATGATVPRRSVHEWLEERLDTLRREWLVLVDQPAVRPAWGFLVSLRPVWWVLRAWVAVQLLALGSGTGMAVALPMPGGPVAGLVLWAAAIGISVQIGRGALWPGSGPGRRLGARLVLLALNWFAVLMLPLVAEQLPTSETWESATYVDPSQDQGLYLDGEPVANVFPYDADGNPIEGVQLFDQRGEPLDVVDWAGREYDDAGERVSVPYPWFNGERELYNVFPLPRREQDAFTEGEERQPDAWTSADPPALPSAPLAVVPPASLPGAPTDQPSTQPSGAPGSDSEKAQGR